jgi:hypothetical protein
MKISNICVHVRAVYTAKTDIKGTVSPDYKCLEVVSIKTFGKDMLLWKFEKF